MLHGGSLKMDHVCARSFAPEELPPAPRSAELPSGYSVPKGGLVSERIKALHYHGRNLLPDSDGVAAPNRYGLHLPPSCKRGHKKFPHHAFLICGARHLWCSNPPQ